MSMFDDVTAIQKDVAFIKALLLIQVHKDIEAPVAHITALSPEAVAGVSTPTN